MKNCDCRKAIQYYSANKKVTCSSLFFHNSLLISDSSSTCTKSRQPSIVHVYNGQTHYNYTGRHPNIFWRRKSLSSSVQSYLWLWYNKKQSKNFNNYHQFSLIIVTNKSRCSLQWKLVSENQGRILSLREYRLHVTERVCLVKWCRRSLVHTILNITLHFSIFSASSLMVSFNCSFLFLSSWKGMSGLNLE